MTIPSSCDALCGHLSSFTVGIASTEETKPRTRMFQTIGASLDFDWHAKQCRLIHHRRPTQRAKTQCPGRSIGLFGGGAVPYSGGIEGERFSRASSRKSAV